ncbi:MAG: hypothetical protein MNPFHGCM_00395 [Gemmatimonadaceae bacterium]|nr:hypothetical protein [Gemmatimonadaceae bacterium]
MRLSLVLAGAVCVATPVLGQSNLKVGASGRGRTEVALTPPSAGGAAPKPVTIVVDYGQPHARGRAVAGALASDLGTVWRLGANDATTLTTGVALTLGTLHVPKGEYTLFAETSKAGEWKLVVNKKTGQWGTEYDAASDLGRTPLKSRALSTPIESLSIWLIPSGDGSPKGELRFAWGTREFSVPWSVR